MPLARACCSTATPASREIRSYVRHEPSAKADTSRPDAPRGRWPSALIARVLSGPHRDERGVAAELARLGRAAEGVARPPAERPAEERQGGGGKQRPNPAGGGARRRA